MPNAQIHAKMPDAETLEIYLSSAQVHKCTNAQMPNTQMLKCANANVKCYAQMPNAQMLKPSNAQTLKCSNAT